MSESKTTWEERAHKYFENLDYHSACYYEKGYLEALSEFKEALKKDIEFQNNVIDNWSELGEPYEKGYQSALNYFKELIDTVQPTEK